MSESIIYDGGSAFPVPYGQVISSEGKGMSLRDWFAGQADVLAYAPIQTFCDNFGRAPTIDELAEYIAKIRLAEADAMIAARKGGAK